MAVTLKSSLQGVNSLDFDLADGPLAMCLLTISYQKSSDDNVVSISRKALFRGIERGDKEKDLLHRVNYSNYALRILLKGKARRGTKTSKGF